MREERVHHHDGGLAFEEGLEREQAVGGITQRLEPRDEVESAILERVRQFVGQKSVFEQRLRREAQRDGSRRRFGRPLGHDEELLLGGIVEAGDLASVERRELLLEERLGVEEADGREGGRVAGEGRGQVLDELLAENSLEVLLVQDRRRHLSRERHAPDFLDELLGAGNCLRKAFGKRAPGGNGRCRQGRRTRREAGRKDGREEPPAAGRDRWTARFAVAYHAPHSGMSVKGNIEAASLAARLLVHS